MFVLLKIKKLIIKLLTCIILDKPIRKNVRNFLYYFSVKDFIKFKRQDFYVVSLGNNCLPRLLTTVIRLKPRKFYGEKTLPFDLCNTRSINVISKFIKTDFANYFNEIYIDKYTYPHDYQLSKSDFKIRYEQRIRNFLNILKSDKKIYFIYSNFNDIVNQNDILNLYDTLLIKRKEKPFELIILSKNKIENIKNKNIHQINIDFCIDDNDWVVFMLNEYGNLNNKYTNFSKIVGDELKNIIK